MKKAFGLTVTMFLALANNASAIERYDCDLAARGGGGFVGSKSIFLLDRITGAGAVMDGITRTVSDKPVTADISKRNDAIWIFRWGLKRVPTANGTASLRYRAMLNTASGRLSLTGFIAGYDNHIGGSGTCKRVN